MKAPLDLKNPIIQCHHQTKDGQRTVAGIGTFNTMLFSEEMRNAEKYGYTFEILWGYTFDRAIIFDDFIKTLYDIRKQYPKTNPMNLIAKLIMNSLYGRFGMNDNFNENIILHKNDYLKFEQKNIDSIKNIIELDEYVLIQYRSNIQDDKTFINSLFETHNINIAIASAITAYARIHMSQFKNNHDYNIYYSDTDSIYIDKPLNDKLISKTELGLMKLEYICEKAIFIAPKVYCLLTNEGLLIYKVKGLSSKIKLTLRDFENLLLKDSKLEKNQEKWFKNLQEGNISILDQIYTLKVTSNKRELIYIRDGENNKLFATKPIILTNKSPFCLASSFPYG